MATTLMPSSLQAQMTRRAISPRFATRIFLNMNYGFPAALRGMQLLLANAEQRHSIFNRAAVSGEHLDDHAPNLRLDLIHKLHGLNNAQYLAFFHRVASFHERRSAW